MLYDVLSALGRRWYVSAAVLILVVAAFFTWHRVGGVWVATPVITFLRPGAQILEPENGLKDESIIGFASTVATQINQGHAPESFAADDAPLYGAGLRQGIRVSVPNIGGQWSTSYSDAEIIIQVVGTDRAWVESTERSLLRDVDLYAAAAQKEAGTSSKFQIVTSVMPLSTQLSHVVSGKQTTVEALGALLFAGLLVGCWGSISLDEALRRRGVARRPDGAAAARPAQKGVFA